MNQLYIHVGEVVSALRYDTDTESYIQSDVRCVRRVFKSCCDCYFHDAADCSRIACSSYERPDGEDVIFKPLKNN